MHTETKVRIYRSQAEAAVGAIEAILVGGEHAGRVLERTLRADRRRGASDRAFIASSVYGVVRYARLYGHLVGVEAARERKEVWRMLGAHVVCYGGTLPPWEEFSALCPSEILDGYHRAQAVRALRESIPDWLDAIGAQELPQVWDAELAAMNTQAPVVLRVNTLRTTRERLQQRLARENRLETRALEGYPDALELSRRAQLSDTEAFRQGWFEVQDASSQRVAPMLAPEPGMRVVDACAGAGGKTLHLAALMQGRGEILALDVHEKRLEELRRRALRAGVSTVNTALATEEEIARREASADRLLLDVPCSGLGTLRRAPDAKWRLSPAFLDQVTALQAQLLASYSRMLRPGGRMVYSTCSVLPRENGRQVARFLEEHPGFRLLEEHSLLSSREGYDGFYMALLQREG